MRNVRGKYKTRTYEEDSVAVIPATTVVTKTIVLPHYHTLLALLLPQLPMDRSGQNYHVLFLLDFLVVLDTEITDQLLHQAFGHTKDEDLVFCSLLDSGKDGVAAVFEGAVIGLVLDEESCEEGERG